LIHHYVDVNLDVLWQTVSVDLPDPVDLLPEVTCDDDGPPE